MTRNLIVGLEGTSFTGKSTLASALSAAFEPREAIIIPCYSECSSQDRPPAVPSSTEEQLAAVQYYLDIERQRHEAATAALDSGRVVIADRTVHTLLAHTFALDRLYNYDAFGRADALVATAVHIQSTVVFHLRASSTTLAGRAIGRPGFPDLYYDEAFVGAFDEYFNTLADERCVHLDAETPVDDLVAVVTTALAEAEPR